MANDSKLDSTWLATRLGPWAAGDGPLYRQLATRLAALIEAGEVRDGELLPPERVLATTLSASRSTIVAAYDQLRAEGRVERRQGSGTRVVGPRLATSVSQEFRTAPLFPTETELGVLLKAIPDRLEGVDRVLASDAARLVHAPSSLLDAVDPEGLLPLRAAIAARYAAEGLPTRPEDIVITGGAQQAVSLVVSALCGPGDVVLTEETTWPGLSDVVARQGGRCYGVRMDEGGIDTSELRAAVERLRPVLIAVNPHHHNPTATRLLPHRRRELADIAAEYGVTLLEDRVAAPLAFDGVVPPPLAVHRADAPVVVADSISKTLWPGLRVGWLRGRPDLVRQVRLAKTIDDQFSPIPTQLLALGLVERLDELVAERVRQLVTRRDLVATLLAEGMPDWEVRVPDGGLVMWPRLPAPVATPFIHHAARAGVLVAGSEAFTVGPRPDDRIRVPFTSSEELLTEAVGRLATAWRSFAYASAASSSPKAASYASSGQVSSASVNTDFEMSRVVTTK